MRMAVVRSLEPHLAGGPTEAAPLIVVDQVRKAYPNGTVALEDISFGVSEGQFVSLVGPSGCGKSTLLRVIAGLAPISGGEVLVEGLEPKAARREHADTAFVFQDATLMPWRHVLGNVELPLELRGVSLMPWRPVLGNVELPLELRGVSRGDRRAAALRSLEMVGLADVARAYPRELSGGMRMRVSLARALAARPRLLLMDEPFGALDEITRQRLNGELLRICALAGWTVLFVTHNVFEAVFLSGRILVMSRQPGRVVAEVPVDLPYPRIPEVRTSPAYSRTVGEVIGLLEEA
jgi:NitT/TauT family transport system ATP-binding protein